jgi:alginate O-acetyltransferase complex protein AlgJ
MPELGSVITAPLSREDIAKIEIGQTNVSPAVVRALVVFFLAVISVVPILEIVGERLASEDRVVSSWSRLTEIPAAIRTHSAGIPTAWSRIVSGNRAVLEALFAFENALEDESVIGETLRPRAQWVLSGWLGAGNERVYVGRDRWLFYRPDLEYLTGAGFLDAGTLRRRMAAASEWTALPHPDARPAILELHR